jgi:hypothetical protein
VDAVQAVLDRLSGSPDEPVQQLVDYARRTSAAILGHLASAAR